MDRYRYTQRGDTVKFRSLQLHDLDKLPTLFKKHLFYMKQDKSVDRSSPERVTKQLYFNYVLNVALGFLGLDTFVSFVALTDDENIIGTITARRFPLGKSWIVGPVVCHRDFRHLGVATNLMNLVMKDLRAKKATSALLSTERNNISGLKFFEKFGFKYLEPVFMDHKGARNYVRRIVLIHGYLRKPPNRIKQYPPMKRNSESAERRAPKIWYVLIKVFDQCQA